ncbi:MAG: DUF4838 domain-containing protein, partial [Armatimonadetes bacterium]|nr:DUF4838 domain-containing protein [Armatimonadota bacterium]
GGNTLHLRAGGNPGAVFGVYEFLRRYGGCRFSGLGPDGELVPSRTSITAGGLPLRRKPKLWYRGPQLSTTGRDRLSEEESTQLCVQWVDWLAKNGFNYLMHNPGFVGGPWFERHIRPEMLKRGLKFDMNHHNLGQWVPAKRHFAEHPEWFPLVDGERVARGGQLAICTSNPGAVQAVIDGVTGYLREHPEVSIIGVIPEDGIGVCQCEACTRLDVANGIDPQEHLRTISFNADGKGNRAKTRRYTLLVNQVARAVRAEFPDVLVGYAAYVDLTCPDEEVPLESNVVPWVAIYWCDGARPIAEGSPSRINRLFYDVLKQWRIRHRGKVITYSYYMGMNAQRSLPYPQDRVILREWRSLKALGIDGATLQERPDSHEIYALNLLAFTRSAWEEDVDPDALLDEYLEGMYGSVAGEIRPIYDGLHAAWRRAEEEGDAGKWPAFSSNRHSGALITPNGRNIVLQMDALGEERLDECLRRARERAGNDRERRQVAKLTQVTQYWKAAAAFYRLEQRATGTAGLSDEDARALREQAERIAQEGAECFNRLPAGWAKSRYTPEKLFPMWKQP